MDEVEDQIVDEEPAKLATLEELKNAVGWQILSTEGRLNVKARYNVGEALSIYADHFGLAADDLVRMFLSGVLIVRDLSDGKEYSGKRIAAVLRVSDADGGSPANAGHARPVVESSSIGLGGGVPQQPQPGGDAVGSAQAEAVSNPSA